MWGLLLLSVCVLAAGLHSLFKGTGRLSLFKTYFAQQVEQIRTITRRHDFFLFFLLMFFSQMPRLVEFEFTNRHTSVTIIGLHSLFKGTGPLKFKTYFAQQVE